MKLGRLRLGVIVLTVCLLCSAFVLAQDIGVINQTITDIGIVLSVDDFNKTMVGPEFKRQSINSSKSYETVNLVMKNLKINGGNISFDADVKYSGAKSKLSASGALYSSYKAQRNINSIIGNLEDATGNFKILLFEIFNDIGKDNLLVRNDKNYKPHLKIYLLDGNKNILFFEMDLPKVFNQLDAKLFPQSDSRHDAFWFIGLTPPEKTSQLTTDNEILMQLGFPTVKPKGLGYFTTWINPTTYYNAFYIGGDYYQCYSLPYLEYKHVNVTSQDSTWTATFKVAEHLQIGSYIYWGTNCVVYKNLQINFGCGDKTTFIRTYQEGRIYDNGIFPALKQVGQKITVTLFNKALSALPYGSTFSTILGYFNTLASAGGDVTLGSTGVSLSNRKTVAVGEKLASNYELETCTDYDGKINNGHYFTYQAVLQYESPSGTSVSTVGALQLKFDVYNYSDNSTTPIPKNFQLDYTSTP